MGSDHKAKTDIIPAATPSTIIPQLCAPRATPTLAADFEPPEPAVSVWAGGVVVADGGETEEAGVSGTPL